METPGILSGVFLFTNVLQISIFGLWLTIAIFDHKGISMKVTFLGSGSAFCMDNWQSNMLIDVDPCESLPSGRRILFDCGSDIRWSLKDSGVSPMDIDAVYVSHLHADHVGGLEYLAFVTYFGKTVRGGTRPAIVGNSQLINDLWDRTLRGGLSSIQTMDADLSTYFDVVRVPANGSFKVGETEFMPVQTIHVVADTSLVKSFGLMVALPEREGRTVRRVLITSDTQYAPSQLNDYIKISDVVFHDCETSAFPSGVHAHYEDLRRLPEDIKSKMYLYHYNSVLNRPDAITDGFRGFVEKGQVFEF